MPNLQTSINKALKALEASAKREKELEAQVRTLRSQRTVLCASCAEEHQICTLDLIRTHWYVQPSGCTDGDYWREGEWQFICPSTSVRNRIMFWDPYEIRDKGNDAESAFKRMYGGLFRSAEKEHKSQTPASWVNNHYINENRGLFELPLKS